MDIRIQEFAFAGQCYCGCCADHYFIRSFRKRISNQKRNKFQIDPFCFDILSVGLAHSVSSVRWDRPLRVGHVGVRTCRPPLSTKGSEKSKINNLYCLMFYLFTSIWLSTRAPSHTSHAYRYRRCRRPIKTKYASHFKSIIHTAADRAMFCVRASVAGCPIVAVRCCFFIFHYWSLNAVYFG